MSYLWWFSSFSPVALERVLTDGDQGRLDDLVALASEEETRFADTLTQGTVARRLLSSGLSYEGFDEKQARIADDVVQLVFSPGGLWEELEMEGVSPDGVHPSVISELMARTETSVLPLLVKGRRAGQDEPVQCEYCILSPAEAAQAVDDAERAMAAPMAWSADYLPEEVAECLVGPLRAGSTDGRWIFASLG